jgi:hypothetical protein
MLHVEKFDKQTNALIIFSDLPSLEEQMTELRSPGVQDIAYDYCNKNGINIDGIRDTSGRDVKFFDKQTMQPIRLVQALSADEKRKGADSNVIVRRLITLAVSSVGPSSLSQLLGNKYGTTTNVKEPVPAEVGSTRKTKSKK